MKRAVPTAGNVDDTSWKSQAYKTTRRRTHNDVHWVENETKFLTAEALEESTVSCQTREQLRRLNRCSSRTRLRVGHTSRCETTGADGPDSAWKPSCSSSTRAASNPWVTQRQVPTIHKIPKTAEIPQVQFVPSCHTETEWLTCPLLCEIMSPGPDSAENR